MINLIDRLLHRTILNITTVATDGRMSEKLRAAKRYVFDAAASAAVGRLGRDHPEQIAEQQTFAQPPHDLTWIEFDARAHYCEVAVGDDRHLGSDAETADTQVGYLITGGLAIGFSHGPNHPDPAILAMAYRLHNPWDGVALEALRGTLELADLDFINQCLWGSSTLRIGRDHPLRGALLARHAPLAVVDPRRVPARQMCSLFESGAGELRMLLAGLLMLNRSAVPVRTEPRPRTQGWVGNKRKPLCEHTVVSFDLSKPTYLRPTYTTPPQPTGIRRPEHEVRFHHAHRWGRTAVACAHVWTRDDGFEEADEADASRHCRWTCYDCSSQRWRRQPHRRGDPSLVPRRTTVRVTA